MEYWVWMIFRTCVGCKIQELALGHSVCIKKYTNILFLWKKILDRIKRFHQSMEHGLIIMCCTYVEGGLMIFT